MSELQKFLSMNCVEPLFRNNLYFLGHWIKSEDFVEDIRVFFIRINNPKTDLSIQCIGAQIL